MSLHAASKPSSSAQDYRRALGARGLEGAEQSPDEALESWLEVQEAERTILDFMAGEVADPALCPSALLRSLQPAGNQPGGQEPDGVRVVAAAGEQVRSQAAAALWDLDVVEMARLVRSGAVSPVELVRAHLERIETTEPSVLAWEQVRAEAALEKAAAAERQLVRGEAVGLLHGVPFAVKDIIHVAGMPTACGSRVPPLQPSRDATVVARLVGAGAICLGKVSTTEFAFGDSAATRNPWNLAHTPGGSSSGSAAAVAVRSAPFALGTQTAGSLNRPAAYCGVCTLKPTYGRVSRAGVVPLAWSLDHVGAFTRSAADQALLLAVMAGPDPEDVTAVDLPVPDGVVSWLEHGARAAEQRAAEAVRGWVVGVPDRYFVDNLDPAVRSAFQQAIATFEGLGVRVETVRLPSCFEVAQSAHTLIIRAEAAAVHEKTLRQLPGVLGPRLRRLLISGSLVPATTYLKAQQLRRRYVQELAGSMARVMAMLTPAAPGPAPAGLAYTGPRTFNAPFSLSGFPTLVLPMGFAEGSGLPVGLQLVGAPFAEQRLLLLGMAYQAVTRWHRACPAMAGEPAPRPVW